MTQEFVMLPREVVEQAVASIEMLNAGKWTQVTALAATLRTALEQPQVEQGPVAWMWEFKYDKGAAFSTKKPNIAISDGVEYVPLYTHPQPKRDPLTDEEIDKLCPQFDDPMRREMWVIGFKAAHGIK